MTTTTRNYEHLQGGGILLSASPQVNLWRRLKVIIDAPPPPEQHCLVANHDSCLEQTLART